MSSDNQDLRSHPRSDVHLPVALGDATNSVEATICFDTHDLSLGGAFLRSELLLEVGEQLELMFHLPEGKCIRTTGRVVHVAREAGADGPAGMGIAFADLSARDREAVRAFLAGQTPA